MALNIPYVGVNHLEGHLFSNIMENTQISFPFISLIVSGDILRYGELIK